MQNDKNTFFSIKQSLNIGGNLIHINSPLIMGILNLTPDSFYSGSRLASRDAIIRRTEKHLSEGADIIDIGGYSSRPGAEHIPEEEERNRIIPALRVIRQHFPDTIISLDTFRASIAQEMVNDYGVNIINDISAGNLDQNMFATIAHLNVPYIMMHMKGTPQDMQQKAQYDNILRDMIGYFSSKLEELNQWGVKDIIIDPGFGFGKTIEHNFYILKHLNLFRYFELPIMVGLSRKSMIFKTLRTSPEEALNGTTALNTLALTKGAHILRVHDVKETQEVIQLMKKYDQINDE